MSMNEEAQRDKSFVGNLGKVYALHTPGFLAFFALMAILEQFGMGARAIGVGAAYIAMQKLTGILGAVGWAFDFACAGLFFPLVLGVWWKRAPAFLGKNRATVVGPLEAG